LSSQSALDCFVSELGQQINDRSAELQMYKRVEKLLLNGSRL
jgi:hypothetical protein